MVGLRCSWKGMDWIGRRMVNGKLVCFVIQRRNDAFRI